MNSFGCFGENELFKNLMRANATHSFLRLTLFLVFPLALIPKPTPAQTCSPVSAQFITSGDDNTYAWVNGTSIGSFPYCGQTTCVPAPVPVPITVFNEGQSLVLSVETDNVNPNLAFSAW